MANSRPENTAETAEWEALKASTTGSLDLDAIRTRADRTLSLYRSYAAADGEFVPLSVRFHFRHDVPALLAEVEQLKLRVDAAKAFADGVIAGADSIRAELAKTRDAVTALHTDINDHIEHLSDKQPWDNRAAFHRMRDGLAALAGVPADGEAQP